METHQAPRTPRERRLLVLLVLLVVLLPWGTGPASGSPCPWPGVQPRPGSALGAHVRTPNRRSLALADDAAFRERARLLAALERRRWLDSYLQKLLLDAA